MENWDWYCFSDCQYEIIFIAQYQKYKNVFHGKIKYKDLRNQISEFFLFTVKERPGIG